MAKKARSLPVSRLEVLTLLKAVAPGEGKRGLSKVALKSKYMVLVS